DLLHRVGDALGVGLRRVSHEFPRQRTAAMSSPVNYTVVPAVVTKNKDKDKNNLGRIKVRYPWMDDTQESDWLPVVSPGAGKERGLYAVPEVHDQVLVAFGYGDPNRGYVLGALWSKDDKPPSDDPALRVFKSV